MKDSVKLGTLWGISVGLHTSWFLVFGLVTWSLASGYFPGEYPQFSTLAHWGLAVLTSLLFFASVLAHEFGHAGIALRNGIPVQGITLFIFGGVARISEEPRSPGAEFRIAIAGPLVSLSLALLFAGLWLLDRQVPLLAAPSLYLARINLLLALFNLIPGFPLDGGRVLRALVWRLTGNFRRATRVASASGQLVAFGFIAFGAFTLLNGNFFNGLWLAFIGWFLQNAAAAANAQVDLKETLKDSQVGQLALRRCQTVPPLTPLSQLVEERVLRNGESCFFVAENGRPGGILTLDKITQVPQAKWPFTTSRQAMVPLSRVARVEPGADLFSALKLMESQGQAQVTVMQGDELVGVLTREQVLNYLRLRAELGA